MGKPANGVAIDTTQPKQEVLSPTKNDVVAKMHAKLPEKLTVTGAGHTAVNGTYTLQPNNGTTLFARYWHDDEETQVEIEMKQNESCIVLDHGTKRAQVLY